MKLQIIKFCRTPLGEHQPGESIQTEQRIGDYLVANGYAKSASNRNAAQSAESPAPAQSETATIETPKGRKPR